MRHFIELLVVCALTLVVVGCQARQTEGEAGKSGVAKGVPNNGGQTSSTANKSKLASYWDKLASYWESMNAWAIVGLIVIGAVGIGTTVMSILSGRSASPAEHWIPKLGPSFFFWLGMTYLAVLLLIAILYNAWERPAPVLIGGILPVGVPWFGALGAVIISLEGVYRENTEWDVKYNYWHIGRPLFGATLGIMAFFIFVVLVTASGTPPKFLEYSQASENRQPATPGPATTGAAGAATDGKNPPANPPGDAPPPNRDMPKSYNFLVFYVLAFLVGYREETFSELIKRVTDLILKPGVLPVPIGPRIALKLGGVVANRIAMENTVQGQTSQKTVEIHNTGDGTLAGLVASISVNPPAAPTTFAFELSDTSDLPKGQSRNLTIKFAPPQAGEFTGTLIVKAANLSEPKKIQVVGTGT